MDVYYDNRGDEGTVRHYIEQLGSGFEWKMILSVAGTLVAMVNGFYGELVWGFLALFSMDLVSGVMKSKHLEIPITSKRLRGSVTKLGAYMMLITALIITSKFEPAFIPIITITYYYFMFTELKSIFENVEQLGVAIPTILKATVDLKLKEADGGVRISQEVTIKEEVTVGMPETVASKESVEEEK